MKRDTLVLMGVEYDFSLIKQRSKKAPIIDINIAKLTHCCENGNARVDHSEVRFVKLDGKYHLLSGFYKLNTIRIMTEADPSVSILSGKLMSVKYLESTRYLPEVEVPVVKAVVTPVVMDVQVKLPTPTKTIEETVDKVYGKLLDEVERGKTMLSIKAKLEGAGFRVSSSKSKSF